MQNIDMMVFWLMTSYSSMSWYQHVDWSHSRHFWSWLKLQIYWTLHKAVISATKWKAH